MRNQIGALSIGLVLALAGCESQSGSAVQLSQNEASVDGPASDSLKNELATKREMCENVAEADLLNYRTFMMECKARELRSKGIQDGLACIDSEGTAGEQCFSPGRYEAEVDAYNICREQRPDEMRVGMTLLDCIYFYSED